MLRQKTHLVFVQSVFSESLPDVMLFTCCYVCRNILWIWLISNLNIDRMIFLMICIFLFQYQLHIQVFSINDVKALDEIRFKLFDFCAESFSTHVNAYRLLILALLIIWCLRYSIHNRGKLSVQTFPSTFSNRESLTGHKLFLTKSWNIK